MPTFASRRIGTGSQSTAALLEPVDGDSVSLASLDSFFHRPILGRWEGGAGAFLSELSLSQSCEVSEACTEGDNGPIDIANLLSSRDPAQALVFGGRRIPNTIETPNGGDFPQNRTNPDGRSFTINLSDMNFTDGAGNSITSSLAELGQFIGIRDPNGDLLRGTVEFSTVQDSAGFSDDFLTYTLPDDFPNDPKFGFGRDQ